MNPLQIAINKTFNKIMYFLIYFLGAFASTRFFLWAQSSVYKLENIYRDQVYFILATVYIIIGGIGFLVILIRLGFYTDNQSLLEKYRTFLLYGFFSGLIFLAAITFGYLR
jgi:hypothetical protein